jgi:hypothetical protein
MGREIFRILGIAGFALTLTGSSALAAAHNPLIPWQGGATLTTVPAACQNGAKGLEVGDMPVSIYRPQLDPAEPRSALTLIFGRAAHSFFKTTSGQMNGGGNYSGAWISARATTKSGGGAVTGTYMFTITPNPVLATTTFVTIDGLVNGFGGISGCNVRFKGSYSRRPN